MLTEENFVTSYAYAIHLGNHKKIEELLKAVWHICTLAKNEEILELLHHMYVSSVSNRENLSDKTLEDITYLYENLRAFYMKKGKEVSNGR